MKNTFRLAHMFHRVVLWCGVPLLFYLISVIPSSAASREHFIKTLLVVELGHYLSTTCFMSCNAFFCFFSLLNPEGVQY